MRGRFNLRHNQRFFPDDDEHDYQELRLQLEVAYASDRNFIEEYYKQLFDRGMDQETLADLVWQKDNQFANLWTEANLQNWYTDTQWLPQGGLLSPGRFLLRQPLHVLHPLGYGLRHDPYRRHGQ